MSCKNNLIGKSKENFEKLVEKLGEQKAQAIYSQYGGFNNNIDTKVQDKFKSDIKELNKFFELKNKSKEFRKKGKQLSDSDFKELKSNTFFKKSHDLELGRTNKLLKDLGIDDKRIFIPYNEIENHLLKKEHTLKIKDLTNLIEAINNPIYVTKDRFNKNRLEILTDIKTDEGANLMLILDFSDNKFGLALNGINVVTTFDFNFGEKIEDQSGNRKKIDRIFNHFDKNRMLYVNKEKIAGFFYTDDTNIMSTKRPRIHSNKSPYETNLHKVFHKIKVFKNIYENKSNNFFEKLPNGNKSELYQSLQEKSKDIESYFETAFSDNFQKNNKWIDAQKRLFNKEKFEDIVDDLKLDPDYFYKKTFEPKIELLDSYRDVTDLGKNILQSKIIDNDKKGEPTRETKKVLINKYAKILKKKFGVNIEVIKKEDLPSDYKGTRGWYNIHQNKIFLVEENMNMDTLFHEMFHPILIVFKRKHAKAYHDLLLDVDNYKNEKWYKSVVKEYSELTPSELQDELIVTAVGLKAKELLNKSKNKSSWKKFIDIVFSFMETLNKELKNTFNIKGNVIFVNNINNLTIDDISKVLLSKSIVFKGIKEQIKDLTVFYDADGNPLKLDNETGLNEFINSLSKDIEDDNNNYSKPNVQNIKEVISNLIEKSNNIKKQKEYNKYYKVNKDNLSVSGFVSSLSKDYSSEEHAVRIYISETNTDAEFEKMKSDIVRFNNTVKDHLKLLKEGHVRLNEILSYVNEENSRRAEIGDSIHLFNERFFKEVDNLRINDFEINRESLDKIADDLVNRFYKSNDKESEDAYRNLAEGLIKTVEEVEAKYKNRNPRYLPELYISSEKLKKEGIIDLAIITDDGTFNIIDTKSKYTIGNKDKSFKNKWYKGFRPYDKEGFTRHWNSGRNNTSIQTSTYSLMLALENPELKADGLGALYIEVEGKTVDNVSSITNRNVREAENGKMIQSLTDFTPEIINTLSNEQKEELFGDKDVEEGAINTIDDYMEHMLGDKVVDKQNYKRQALNKYEYNLEENPENPDELGYYDKYGPQVLSGRNIVYPFIVLVNKVNKEKTINKDIALEMLEDYYKRADGQNEIILDNAISYHKTRSWNFNSFINDSQKGYISSMLQGIDENWELRKINTFPGMQDNNEPILVATNIHTNKSRILYFSRDASENINFQKGSKIQKTIFGNISDEKYIKTKFKNSALRNANKENFRLLKSTALVTKLKLYDDSFNIDRIIISNGVNSGVKPKPFSIESALTLLKMSNKVISDSGEIKFAGYMKKIFDNNKLFNPKSYKPDAIDNMLHTFNESLFISEKTYKNINGAITKYRNQQSTSLDVLDTLNTIKNDLIVSILASGEYNDKFEESPEYIALSNAILDLRNIKSVALDGKISFLSDKVVLERNSPVYFRRAMSSEITNADVQIRREVKSYEIEKEKLIRALAKDKNIPLTSKMILGNIKKLYSNMFLNINDYNNPGTLMQLKSVDDPSLSKAEVNFINFFNKTIHDTTKFMAPDLFKNLNTIEEEKELVAGWVPVYKALKQKRNILGEKEVRENSSVDKDYDARSKMQKDVGNKFKNRAVLAGYDSKTGEMKEGFDFRNNVEINLEAVMTNMVVEGTEAKAHDRTLLVYEAMRSVLTGEYFLFGDESSVNSVVNSLDEMRDQYIFSESTLKTTWDRRFAKIEKLATATVIISGKQAIMDTLTFGFSSSATLVANTINKLWDKNVTKQIGFFGFKSWVKAGRFLISNRKLMYQIQALYGLDENEAMYLKSANALKSMRSNWMEIGFTPTRSTMKAIHMQMMLASMIEDGSINAYSLDDNDLLVYNEKKDPRFYNDKGELINEEFLLAVKKQAFNEGYNLEEYDEENPKDLIDRKLLAGYTFKERETIRSKSVDMIGVIGKEGNSRLSRIIVFRHFMKFKSWVLPKAGLYFRKNHMSEIYAEWERVEKEDGTFEYVISPTETEGIFQSLSSILNKLMVYKLRIAANGGLSSIEKRNVSILASHLLHYGALAGLVMSLDFTCDEDDKDCWLTHKQAGKSTTALLQNVEGDLFVPISIYNMIFGRGSMFAGLDSMIKTTKRIITLPWAIIEDNGEKASTTANEAMVKSWALYRDSYTLVELLTPDDKVLEGFENEMFPLGDWDEDFSKKIDETFNFEEKK